MPAVIAAAIIKAIGAVGVWASVIQFVVSAVFYTAISMGLNAAFGKKSSGATGNLQGRMTMVREPTAPRQIIYGECRVSGPLLFAATNGIDNEYLGLIIALAGHEVEEIGDVYFNDELAISGSGTSATGRFVGFVDCSKGLGSDTQAHDTTISTHMGIGAWPTTSTLKGVAYLYIRLKWDREVFTGGIPNISCIVKGAKVYDYRDTTTAYSRNPALCLYDFMSNDRYGLGIPAASFDTATTWTAAANVCDEQVNLDGGGTQTRYECDGRTDTSESGDTTVATLLECFAGRLFDVAGEYRLYAGAYVTPTSSFDEDDLRGPIVVQAEVTRREKVNAVKGTFANPADDYQPVDFPSVQNSAYQTIDGEELWTDIVLPWTTNSLMAQRLAKIKLLKNRQSLTCSMPCKLTAMKAQIGDYVTVSNTDLGWTNKVFEIVAFSFTSHDIDGSPGIGVDLQLREMSSTVFDWSTTEEQALASSPNTTLPDPYTVQPPTGLWANADQGTAIAGADGGWTPRIYAQWTPSISSWVLSGGRHEVQYKLSSGDPDDWVTWTLTEGTQDRTWISGVRHNETYDIRVRAISVIGVHSAWATLLNKNVTVDVVGPGSVSGITSWSNDFWTEADHDRWFSWTNPTDLDFKWVKITWKVTGAGSWAGTYYTKSDTFLLRNLSSTADYTMEFTTYDRSNNVGALAVGYSWAGKTVVAAQADPLPFQQPVVLGSSANKYGNLTTYGVTDPDPATGGDGVFIGYKTTTDTAPYFRIGSSTSYMKWDPTNGLIVSGQITGGSMDVGSGHTRTRINVVAGIIMIGEDGTEGGGDRIFIWNRSAGVGHELRIDAEGDEMVSIRADEDGIWNYGTIELTDNETTRQIFLNPHNGHGFSMDHLGASGRIGKTTNLEAFGSDGHFAVEGNVNIYGGGVNFDGGLETFDTNLYRDAANRLKTDDEFEALRIGIGGDPDTSYGLTVNAAASSQAAYLRGQNNYALDLRRNTYGATTGSHGVMKMYVDLDATTYGDPSDGFGPAVYFGHNDDGTLRNYVILRAVRDGTNSTGRLRISPYSSGAIANGLSVEANLVVAEHDLTVTNDLSVGGGYMTMGRNDSVNEGSQIDFTKASTNNRGWYLDLYASGMRINRDVTNNDTATATFSVTFGAGAYAQFGDTTYIRTGGTDLYRSANDGSLVLWGGNKDGANIELYGGAHSGSADRCYIDASIVYFRTQSGSTRASVIGSNINVVSGGSYQVNGTKVVQGQGAAISAPSITGSYAGTDWSTESIDVANDITALETAVNTIRSRLSAHGLVA